MVLLKLNIFLICIIAIANHSQAQIHSKDVYHFDLDLNVEQVIEVQYQFDFSSRKCEERKRSIIKFSNEGKVISEEIYKDKDLVEQSNYIYNSEGRLSEIQSDLNKKYNYEQQGDTLIILESSNLGVMEYRCIYVDNLLDHLLVYNNGTLQSKEQFQYSANTMRGKNVQHYNSDGNGGVSETHRYKNGRTVFFRKRNSEKDNKSCHYYFNVIDGSLDFEETARPGMDAVISKDCNYMYDHDYWFGKSEEHFSVPLSDKNLSYKQHHLFYFRKIILKDGTKIGSLRVQKDFVDRFIE